MLLLDLRWICRHGSASDGKNCKRVRHLRTTGQRQPALLVAAGGADDRGTQRTQPLAGNLTDATGRGMKQHGVARLHAQGFHGGEQGRAAAGEQPGVGQVVDEGAALGVEPEAAEIAMVPQNLVKLEGKDAQTMLRLMEAIEDHDDVQNVWANFDIEEKEIEASLA